MKRRRVLVGVVALALAVSGLVVAVWPASADTPPRRIVSGWLPYWTAAASLATVDANADLWSDASPFWYAATGATTVLPKSGAGDPAVVSDLRGRGVLVLPTVTETLNAADMAALLADPVQRSAHVQTLVDLVTGNGFDGIDLDYESMNYGGTAEQKAAVRDGFVALAGELGAALDAQGKLLSVTVGARTATTNWWPVHDYARLGAVADRFRIMAYDYHGASSTPGAVAPLGWVQQVVSYAVSVVPKGKIQLGVPLYGYDWPQDPAAADGWGRATALTYRQAEALRIAVGAARQWSSTDGAPYFTYTKDGVAHQVWYNDVDSTKAKMTFVGTYGLKGLAFWAVGYEDDRQWPILRDYAIQKTTTLAIASPSAVTYGSRATVTGTLLTSSGAPAAGQTVNLLYRPAGSTTWRIAGSGVTSPTGTVAISYLVPMNGSFRLSAPSSWSYLASASAARAILVRWRVTAAFYDATVSRGTAAKLRGSVAPARAGTTVYRERYSGGTWTSVGSTKVAADGTYAFSFTWYTAGTYTYRVRVPGTTQFATGYSPTRLLYVS
jgi:spore germination protein